MSSRPSIDRWVEIHDRIASGQMPPPDQPRPAADEVRAAVDWIKPRLAAADRSRREVVQRRLNREEYRNTIGDLLDVWIDVEKFLPEDQRAGGFDNNGEALAISAELMGSYLAAANAALDQAIVHGKRPEPQTFTVDALEEVKKYIGDLYNLVDDRVTIYVSEEGQYSKISSRKKRLPVAGKYRFRFQAASHRTEKAVAFTVVASDFANVGGIYKTLGHFEAGPEPKWFEIEATLDAKFAIQFFALGLAKWAKDPTKSDIPGVGWGPIEITGPICDSWPPVSHTRLLGDVDLEKGTLDDVAPILRRLMDRAFRRPATDEEVSRYVDLVKNRLAAGRSFEQSLKAGLAAILCSPNFLYLRENVREKTDRIDDYELASRLSYFLWKSQPDDELLRLAKDQKLSEPAVLRRQTQRLLKDPKGQRWIASFVGQWLHLREIDATTPDNKFYPEFDELLKISMVQESEAFFRKLLEDDLPIENFIDSRFAMLNGRLAKHYGIEGVEGLAIRQVPLPEGSIRGGVLTQASVLKVTANGTSTSPVTRGVWVLENVLGHKIPPPPPNTGGLEPDTRGATTIREQLEKHRNVASCNSCHRYIDPPGFALESFDPVGKYREKYLRWQPNSKFPEKGWGTVAPGAAVDSTGKLPTGEAFADIRQFKKLLLEQKQPFARCLTEKIATFALGRELGFADRDAVTAILSASEKQNHGLASLVQAIISSPPFSTR